MITWFPVEKVNFLTGERHDRRTVYFSHNFVLCSFRIWRKCHGKHECTSILLNHIVERVLPRNAGRHQRTVDPIA